MSAAAVFAVCVGGLVPLAAGAQEAEFDGYSGVESWSVAVSGEQESEAWQVAKAGALVALEGLRADVQTLAALSELQSRLREWNVALLESGSSLVFLETDLCEEPEVSVWCDLLPVTFGRVEEAGG